MTHGALDRLSGAHSTGIRPLSATATGGSRGEHADDVLNTAFRLQRLMVRRPEPSRDGDAHRYENCSPG